MTPRTPPTMTQEMETKLANATDDFIGKALPTWLTQASPSQINRLRDRVKTLKACHRRTRAATEALVPLQDFAQARLQPLLPSHRLAEGLEWREVLPGLSISPGSGWLDYQSNEIRQPALLRLMQNFHEGATFYEGSGVVVPGEQTVLTPDLTRLVRECRSLDVGGGYQALLTCVFNQATCDILADEKRAGLRLAITVAALQGKLDAATEAAMEQVAGGITEQGEQAVAAYPGSLMLLGQPIADGLLVQLRNLHGDDQGVVLYLPSDPVAVFRHFPSASAMNQAMAAMLGRPAYRQYFTQLIELGERPGVQALLARRLVDPHPDLQIEGAPLDGGVFDTLVREHVRRLKNDARLLLVPTAEVDHQASKARLQAWKEAGLGVVNLAGLFIPIVGELLFAQFVVQTLSQVFEGVEDWYQGHQYEALEHMLGVAENLAVYAVLTVGGALVARGFSRSRFVDGLEPVVVEEGDQRLWSSDLNAYACTPEDAVPGPDGLCGTGSRRWLRVGRHYYEVHKPREHGPWRLRHPQRKNAFGPIVETNGERSWRLRQDIPLEWDDSARMLDTLWPLREPLDTDRAEQVLRIVGMDQAGLRGLLVENRRVPWYLRDTLRRFEADERVEAFFRNLQGGTATNDPQLEAWCEAQPGMQGLDPQARRSALLAEQWQVREGLFEFLSQEAPVDDPLLSLVRRDFPGLPEAYAQHVIHAVPVVQRRLALAESRMPLALARKARALLQQASLTRAVEGLYLRNAYSDAMGELVLCLLARLPNWPRTVNLEVRKGTDTGPRLAVLDPQGDEKTSIRLVRKQGRFRLYDYYGRERDEALAAPADLFQVITALLTPAQLADLGITEANAASALRLQLQQHLPQTHSQRLRLLGWREKAPLFVPGHRLADGRFGYPLSGRGAARRNSRDTLRVRIRALYVNFSDEQVEEFLVQMLRMPGSPFEMMLLQESQFARLDEVLEHWTLSERNVSGQTIRQRVADRLRRYWRLQGEGISREDGQSQGMRLDLSGFPLRNLPSLPARVDFKHVTELTLSGLELDDVPVGFLRSFSSVQRLSLTDNHLSRMPLGLTHLTELRILHLERNTIQLDLASIGILRALSRLEEVNLSYNPIGSLEMRWNHLPQLSQLRLRHCRLSAWPTGLELCERLQYVDLRDNQISAIPRQILRMPVTYRASFMLENNPLPASEVARMATLVVDHLPHGSPQGASEELTDARELWLQASRHETRRQWDRVFAHRESEGLAQLLRELQRCADFREARDYLAEQVWALVQALADDAGLRGRVFAQANRPRTCSDSVAHVFSELQVQRLVAEAERHASLQEQGEELLNLGRRLFRLDQLERFARWDVARRAAAGQTVDAVEVSLFYRVRLAQPLSLPFQPRTLQFGNLANVNEEQVQEALHAVQAAEATPELADSLSQRSFWRNYLAARHPAAFDRIQDEYASRGDRLYERRSELPSQQYMEHWDRLVVERESAQQTLVLQLTREALELQGVAQDGQIGHPH